MLKAGTMTFVFDPPARVAAAVAGSDQKFPVRRIFCVGRNYTDHVREMGNDPKSEPPVFFTKPADALTPDGAAIPYSLATENLHYEVEMVLALGRGGTDISERDALGHIWGYAVGVDLTRRDLQAQAKKGGAPWDAGKAFDNAAPLGAISPVDAVGHRETGRIWLSVNGAVKQDADISEMIWSVPEIIAHLSRLWTLAPGDLVFTGTPSGVGPLVAGDVVECGVEGLSTLKFSVVTRP